MVDDFSTPATIVKSIFARKFEAEDYVYHYTTLDSFLEILKSRVLFASGIDYLDDASEFTHVLKLIAEAGAMLWGPSRPAENSTLLAKVLAFIEPTNIMRFETFYVASFTLQGDKLSQWRGYSSFGKGVSFAFSGQDISECADWQSFRLGACRYKKDEHSAIGLTLANAVADVVRRDNVDLEDQAAHDLRVHIQEIAPFIKHKIFEEEEEWRIVSPRTKYLDGKVKFRPGKYNVIPYLDFSLPHMVTGKLRIWRCILGPTSDYVKSSRSLAMLLSKYNNKAAGIVSSYDHPYKG